MTASDPPCVCGYRKSMHALGTLRCPEAKAAKYREPVPELTKLWCGLVVPISPAELKQIAAAVDEADPVAALPPQVPARPPTSAGEFAGYQGKQAMGLGRKAIDLGWRVVPLYWRAGDGTEGCGAWLSRDDLRAFATWKRKPGNLGAKSGWGADIAYAWRVGAKAVPSKITHTQLEGIIE